MVTLTNARLFDGGKMLPGTHSVTLDGNKIASVGERSGVSSGETIDLGGMTLMPGLITCHFHPDFYKFTLPMGFAGDQLGKEFPPGVLMAMGVRQCGVLLESGFTGYVGASASNDIDACLKIAIAEKILQGPRIRACSHHIGTTADANDSKKWWQKFQQQGTDLYADGPDAMRKLVREEIRRGAETIKIFASNGHGIPGKGVRNMSWDEIAAVIHASHERGVKVRAHLNDRTMILECVALGLDIIDHGDEIDEECIEAMAKAGTFWVPSLVYPKCFIDLGWADAAAIHWYEHVRKTLPLAQKAGVKILIGDDYSGVFRDALEDDPLDHQVGNYGREFAFYNEIEGLEPADILSWGTKNAGEALLDGEGKVGVIEAGAFADLIVVDGDPLADLSILAKPQQHLKAVIRDGAMLIDRLPPQNRRMAA